MRFRFQILIALVIAKVYSAKNCGEGIGKCSNDSCCSRHGYCGIGDDYCGTGCQKDFGKCNSSSSSSSAQTTQTTQPQTVSTNERCGPEFGNTICPSGHCCSQYGWCGRRDIHCEAGCQPKYGLCNLSSTTTTSSSNTDSSHHPISKDGRCGPKNNNTVCPKNQCCSKYGWCGNLSDYCETGCQPEFGRCGGSTSSSSSSSSSSAHTSSTRNSSSSSSSSSSSLPISKDGRCGTDFGTRCPYGSCCSSYGWCSTKKNHCNSGCQHGYGDCAEDLSKRIKVFTKCVHDHHWALTFDDGPYIYDDALLDYLKSKNIKATFFVIGKSFTGDKSEFSRIIKRMYKEGHEVQNHTFSHINLNEHSKETIIENITKFEKALKEVIGVKPAFIRPPYGEGAYDPTIQETIKNLGYKGIIMWNVDTMDWDNAGDTDYAIQKFSKSLGEPIISLNHDFYKKITKEKLINSAKKEIEYMIKNGYTPVTMSECTGYAPYQ